MQEVLSSSRPSIPLCERFVREDVLGQGGFSTVYLVRDRDADRKRFALKELFDQSRQEKMRFLRECELLMRLDHPSLPKVWSIFEAEGRAYMLMEYIEGSNLELLRKQRTVQCFSLSEVYSILSPVVEALSYIHNQALPIVHRDIKPANIIVSPELERAVLVDFGIAKLYHSEATTTAIRRYTPGYGAPEQYSTDGTDVRTDVYGLAATCYTLLSGAVPADALQRVTAVTTRRVDPLVQINELVPSLLPGVAHALHRALSLDNAQRYATVKEFWQALKANNAQKPLPLAPTILAEPMVLSLTRTEQKSETTTGTSLRGGEKGIGGEEIYKEPPYHSRLALPHSLKPRIIREATTSQLREKKRFPIYLRALAILIIMFGIVGGVGMLRMGGIPFVPGAGLMRSDGQTMTPQAVDSSKQAKQESPMPTPFPTAATPEPSSAGQARPYPRLSQSYAGTMSELSTKEAMYMHLFDIEQQAGEFSGSFSNRNMSSPSSGVLDMSHHILFTVTDHAKGTSFFFQGSVRSDGHLVGNYCRLNPAGQCVGDYGLWSVAPATS